MSLTKLKVRRILRACKSLAAMKWLAVTAMAIGSVALLACTKLHGSEQPSHAGPVPNSSSSPQVRSENAALQFKKGMAYADLRKLVIDAGWRPVADPQCKANVIGESYANLCSAHPELDDCRVCDDTPELGSCSGDGYCGMTFMGKAKKMQVTTYGMIEDRSISGDQSRLQVIGWKIEAP